MFYVKSVTTAANTTRADTVVSRKKVWAGVIHHVEIMFPPGCAGLLHVTIWRGGHQMFPSDELQEFAGDGETIKFKDYHKLIPGDNQILIKTFNEDETFSHTVRVRLGVLPEMIVNPEQIFRGILTSLQTLLRRIGAT